MLEAEQEGSSTVRLRSLATAHRPGPLCWARLRQPLEALSVQLLLVHGSLSDSQTVSRGTPRDRTCLTTEGLGGQGGQEMPREASSHGMKPNSGISGWLREVALEPDILGSHLRPGPCGPFPTCSTRTPYAPGLAHRAGMARHGFSLHSTLAQPG